MTASAVAHDPARTAALALAVAETTSDAVIGHGPDGLITTWNTAAERIFGARRDEVIGTSFAAFFNHHSGDRWREMLARVRIGERVSLPIVNLRRKGGLVVTASAHLSPLRDVDGGFLGSALVVHDRTEERIAQQTLAAGEQQVRRSEALASAGSFVIDGEYLSEQWSEGMHRIYQVSPENFEGSRAAHLALVHPDDRADVASMMAAALERGAAAELDHRLASDDTVWIFLAVEPATDQFGRSTGISGFCQDVSVRKEAEAKVHAALLAEQQVSEELRHLDALKDDFLATVSHEFRTPLTSISGYAAVLAKKHPELDGLIRPIERSSAELSRTVETLLDFCRLSAGQVVVRPQPITLAALVDACMPQVDGLPEVRNEVAADFKVVADPDALRRILGHLLSNAVRYAGPASRVTITATTDSSAATVISVADNGPGIAAIHQERVFERFYQVPDEAARRGTGIGLAIVQEYADKLGGSVWCESALGAGATFFVRLP